MFKKVLIANRGEIALRVHRSCQEMGIETVAVHSLADSDAMHVRLADESVCIGPPPAADSYLNTYAILSACQVSSADAVHPGYGFLSENASFAEILEEHGISFIGPTAEHIRLMGDKIAARTTAKDLGIPVVPGSPGALQDIAEARVLAEEIGYPVIVKAAAGGGGRGMQVVQEAGDLEQAFSLARAEAGAAFGDSSVYVEKYLPAPRHIEIQVMGDGRGKVLHLGERDCSIQRRHQKLFEEAPSPALKSGEGTRLGELVAEALGRLCYRGAGTVEFLYQDGEFYFIEMNTRLQVEHPVTEMITGIDLVREQIRVAAGEELSLSQDDVRFKGHAVECRINAEDPDSFAPSPGLVERFHAPGGLGVRVDSGLYSGFRIPPYYDSLIAKLIVYGDDRDHCMLRLKRALSEMVVEGVDTSIPLFQRLLGEDVFLSGGYDIHWLERYLGLKE
ncbi:MAG: acetyl-CoA carboxylase biotin carboxylase subunit [Hyphomicrobiales bacterium]|nr:acetyl-CoA carboxylase biotin carboxylase subunit [Hyphomicrobiales bacterium]MCY4048248.1 acetyl-CoA carboxylase biotin carboxylase subunit [Hyphomicrobiales bacterium]MCY4053529.1 acetyl-CoA carboxylase biotin carboxylase subunit [Hyphomicrobiales bacterium]